MDNKEYKQKWLESIQSIVKRTVMEAHEIQVVDVDQDGIELVMEIKDMDRQPMGMLHGGISMLLAESAASMHATWGIDLEEKIPVGIEISGSHVRSASQGKVRTRAKVVRRSSSLIVHQVDILHEDGDVLLSTIRVTNFYKRLKKSSDKNR